MRSLRRRGHKWRGYFVPFDAPHSVGNQETTAAMTTEKKIEQFAESVRVAEVRRQRIMALLDDGMTRKEIAALEGMSYGRVVQIINKIKNRDA